MWLHVWQGVCAVMWSSSWKEFVEFNQKNKTSTFARKDYLERQRLSSNSNTLLSCRVTRTMCSSVVQIIVLCLLLTRLSLIFRSQRPTRSKRTVSFQVQRDLIASVWKFCDICQPWPDSHMWWWRKICSLALEACGGLKVILISFMTKAISYSVVF